MSQTKKTPMMYKLGPGRYDYLIEEIERFCNSPEGNSLFQQYRQEYEQLCVEYAYKLLSHEKTRELWARITKGKKSFCPFWRLRIHAEGVCVEQIIERENETIPFKSLGMEIIKKQYIIDALVRVMLQKAYEHYADHLAELNYSFDTYPIYLSVESFIDSKRASDIKAFLGFCCDYYRIMLDHFQNPNLRENQMYYLVLTIQICYRTIMQQKTKNMSFRESTIYERKNKEYSDFWFDEYFPRYWIHPGVIEFSTSPPTPEKAKREKQELEKW